MKKRYLFISLALAGLLAAYLSLPRASTRRVARDTIEGLAQETGLKLPPHAHIVGVHRERGIDDYAAIKLEMNEADARELLASSPIDPQAMRPDAVAYSGLDRSFWDPNKARGFRAAQFHSDSTFRTLNVGVSAPTDGVVAVYIISHRQ